MCETAVGDMNVCVGNAVDLSQKEGSERNIVFQGAIEWERLNSDYRQSKTKPIAEFAKHQTKLTKSTQSQFNFKLFYRLRAILIFLDKNYCFLFAILTKCIF